MLGDIALGLDGLYSDGLRQLRTELDQKYDLENISCMSYALAVDLHCLDSGSADPDRKAAFCMLADRNVVKREYASASGASGLTFYPMAFHPACMPSLMQFSHCWFQHLTWVLHSAYIRALAWWIPIIEFLSPCFPGPFSGSNILIPVAAMVPVPCIPYTEHSVIGLLTSCIYLTSKTWRNERSSTTSTLFFNYHQPRRQFSKEGNTFHVGK